VDAGVKILSGGGLKFLQERTFATTASVAELSGYEAAHGGSS
jgi:hypothetical protein